MSWTNSGRPRPSPASGAAQEGLQVLGDDLMEHGVLGVAGPVVCSFRGGGELLAAQTFGRFGHSQCRERTAATVWKHVTR